MIDFDFCFLNVDRHPRIGCDIPKYAGERLPRMEIWTRYHYWSIALLPSGRFSKIKNYYPGMPVKDMTYKTKWWMHKKIR